MQIAIIGLPYSGKTTLFEAITGTHGAAGAHEPSAHSATVTVPDDRLDAIARTVSPEKVTHAHVDFVDVPGVALDMQRERVADILSASRESDGVVHVVRHFDAPSAPPHPHGSLDPKRDIAELEAELIVADLDLIERRIVKLEKQVLRGGTAQERDRKELAAIKRLKEGLEQGLRASAIPLSAEESAVLRSLQLLTTKPVLNVLNVAEGALSSEATKMAAQRLGPDAVVICAQVEKEIAELKPEERAEFLQGLGIGEPASRKIIRACYHAVGHRSFFTADRPEARAWTIQAGDTAQTAAGKIHSDLARGFIRAEVIAYEDFVKYGSIKEAKNQGRMRLEGKDYAVQDGDILLIRFKV